MSCFLVLNRLNVHKMNAMANSYLTNSIGMSAVFGFAHNMSRQLNFNLKEVGLVVHDLHLLGANTPNEKKYMKGSAKNSKVVFDIPKSSALMACDSKKPKHSPSGVPGQPAVLMDGMLSIILEIDSDIPLRKIRAFLNNSKFSGGYFSNKSFDISIECEKSSLAQVIGSGSAVINANHHVNKKNKLTSMLLLSSLFAIKNNFFMTSVGYSQVTDLSNDSVGVRNNLPHAYCESIVNLCEYRNIRKGGAFNDDFPMWKYVVDKNNYFLNGDHQVFSEKVCLRKKRLKGKY